MRWPVDRYAIISATAMLVTIYVKIEAGPNPARSYDLDKGEWERLKKRVWAVL